MAKSLRSKVKRSFRSKKRETGVYAAASAARLNRLNAKLVEVTKMAPVGALNIPREEENTEDIPGWCWFATFGLLDPDDITLEGLEGFYTSTNPTQRRRCITDLPWSDSDSSEDSS